MLKNIIKVDENFQYSINLQYDLSDLEKINNYIPTDMSYRILKDYLKSITKDSKERSTLLIGPYGKGKSHLMLILLGLVSRDKREELSPLINKLNNMDDEFKGLFRDIEKNNLLPVIVNSNYTDLSQGFLLALNNSLKKEGLDKLIPNTYYSVVLDTIKKWEKEYPTTYDKLIEIVKDKGVSIESFIKNIESFDNKSYRLFQDIYPEITAGAIFNPLIQSDIVKLYEDINNKLCETTDFNGLFIVYDEFSKFIESSVDNNVAKDLKILQDMAELSVRSKEKQIHIACVTHKSINDYIFKLPKEKINAWRAVEGRFKEIYFTSSSSQNYELIANTIIKKDGFEEYYSNNKDEISEVLDEAYRHGLFKGVKSEIIEKGCYPLNPLTTFALIRVSEKVAQNERTLFTFLSKNEKGSLASFIEENKEDTLLTIDHIYDYFEDLFKKEVFDKNIYRIWLKANSAIKKINEINDKKLIKAIAVIYIVNEIRTFMPTDTIIKNSLMLKGSEYDLSIERLKENRILMKNKSNDFYNFLTGSNVDIKKYIGETKDSISNKFNVRESLEKIIDLGYIVPKKYNNDYEMIRFYKKAFITIDQFMALENVYELLKEYKADGIVLHLIYFDKKDVKKAINKFKNMSLNKFDENRVLLCIPNTPFDKERLDDLKIYLSINKLKENEEFIKSDDYVLNELNLYEEDIVDTLKIYVNRNFSSNGNCKFYKNSGVIKNIKKSADLNRTISVLCEGAYKNTPILNNELINKNSITSPILKARNKIIKYIFENLSKDERDSLEGKGPEVTIFRMMIENKGLLESPRSNDSKLNGVLDVIEDFVKKSEISKTSFGELYNTLTGGGIGLRKGVIPIYLAYIMNQYKEYMSIYFGRKEIPLTVELLNKINENPNDYELFLEDGTIAKVNYIETLSTIFNDYRAKKAVGYNIYGNIIEAMQNYIRSIPKYTREFKVIMKEEKNQQLPEEYQLIRNELLKYEVNPREVLLEWIPNRVFSNKSFEDIINSVSNMKELFDNHIKNLKRFLVNKVISIFDPNYEGELGSLLISWCQNLDDEFKQFQHPILIQDILKLLSTLNTHDEVQIISRIGKVVTGLNIEDWNDSLTEEFIDKIVAFKEYVDEFDVEENEVASGINEDIKEIEELTPTAQILCDEIESVLEDYGDSIEFEEKVSVLSQLLERLKKERFNWKS